MRIGPHHHPCQRCGAKTECGGTWEQNYDGVPEVICPEFHLDGGEVNPDFVCPGCYGGFAPNHEEVAVTLSEILREAESERPTDGGIGELACMICDTLLPLSADHYPYCEDCAREVALEDEP